MIKRDEMAAMPADQLAQALLAQLTTDRLLDENGQDPHRDRFLNYAYDLAEQVGRGNTELIIETMEQVMGAELGNGIVQEHDTPTAIKMGVIGSMVDYIANPGVKAEVIGYLGESYRSGSFAGYEGGDRGYVMTMLPRIIENAMRGDEGRHVEVGLAAINAYRGIGEGYEGEGYYDARLGTPRYIVNVAKNYGQLEVQIAAVEALAESAAVLSSLPKGASAGDGSRVDSVVRNMATVALRWVEVGLGQKEPDYSWVSAPSEEDVRQLSRQAAELLGSFVNLPKADHAGNREAEKKAVDIGQWLMGVGWQ